MILDLITRAVAEEEAVAEAQPSWFENAFGDFAEFPVWAWIVVAVLLVGGLVAYRQIKSGKKTVWNTKMLALGAVCMALSNVLSMIKLFDMPQGGSVTPASMLPLMLFAYVYGVGPGMTVGAVYGVMQFIIEPYFLSVPQMLLDYPIAFAMVGLAGLFSKNENRALGLSLGVVLGSLGRFVAAVLSGEGIMDFPRLFRRLAQMGYTGAAILEPYAIQGRDPQRLRRSLDYLRRQMEEAQA